jgi:LPPG:FO 2-phospho-L-lactate transferase
LALKNERRIVLLVGGVGGAKLALGLSRIVDPARLTIIVNTGDDFWHYGLRICPDLDTVLYTLSGLVDKVNGWGVAGDSTTTLDTLRTLGEEPWFRLGDRDLATHLLRTHLLRQGHTLTDVIAHLARQLNLKMSILPMTDAEVSTMVDTLEHGELEFQNYFVRHRWQPTMRGLRYRGIVQASMSDAARAALAQADAIIIGPSNPWLSINPILSVPGMRERIVERSVPRVAVTPIVQGDAIKGPAAKLMREMGIKTTPSSIIETYGDLLTGFVYDERDQIDFSSGLDLRAFDTIMKTDDDKIRLAQQVLDWLDEMDQP